MSRTKHSKRTIARAIALACAVLAGLSVAAQHPASTTPATELRLGDARFPEGNGTTKGAAKIAFRLSQPLTPTAPKSAHYVYYHTVDGSAGANVDYVPKVQNKAFVKIMDG